jgi:hypothetical protein
MISRLAINYFDILIMERNLHVFADPVNHCFQEILFHRTPSNVPQKGSRSVQKLLEHTKKIEEFLA